MQLFNTPIDDFIELENKVLLSGCSLLFDEKFTVAYNFKNFIMEHELLDEEVAQRMRRIGPSESGDLELNFIQTPKIIAYVFEKVTPFNLMYSNNWFHFLIESLPSLLEGIVKGQVNRDTLIVCGKLHINMLQVLHSLFDNRLNILQLDPMRGVYSEKIIYLKSSFMCHELQNGAINSDYYFNGLNITLLKTVLEKNLRFSLNYIAGRKLFIVRQSFQRNITNINELIALAEDCGYDIIFPETLTFLEQVKLFSSAEVIVGPTGAWLANLLFVNNQAQVFVLNPSTATAVTSIWKMLGEIIDVSVTDFYFEVNKINEYQPIHSDFYVDRKIFENLLKVKYPPDNL